METLCKMEECLEVHVVLGEGDFRVKVWAESPQAFYCLLREEVQRLPGVDGEGRRRRSGA
jgi:DNA-binding Lrp family transcriptional regulator